MKPNFRALANRFKLQAVLLLLGVLAWAYAIPPLQAVRDEAGDRYTALDRELRSLNAQSQLLGNDLQALVRLRADYDALVADGFTRRPDRLQAALLIEELARKHQLGTATYAFQAEQPHPAGLRRGDLSVRSTAIALELRSVLDRSLFGFLADLSERLPGHLSWREVLVDRTRAIDPLVLVQMEEGERPSFLTAQLRLDWSTLAQGQAETQP